jgi:REP-associated tyrosine transposase
MPRRSRAMTAGFVFHVLNRAVRRASLFSTPKDFIAFEQVLAQGMQRSPMRLMAYCAMPNHWHLVLWPEQNKDLSRFMHWITTTHAQRWHAFFGTSGTGPVYQGRYKAIPIQCDGKPLMVFRYVERNPVRAGLVSRAEDWRWSSLWRRRNYCDDGWLCDWPMPIPEDWIDRASDPATEHESDGIRAAIARGAPVGSDSWRAEAVRLLSLESSLRSPGRPARNDSPLSPLA